MMRRWGIRKKVLMLALVPTATITLAMGLFFAHSWVTGIADLLEDRGRSLSRQLGAATEFGLYTRNQPQLFSLASAMLEEPDVRSVTVFDASRQPVVHAGPRLSANLRQDLSLAGLSQTLPGTGTSLYITPVELQDFTVDSLDQKPKVYTDGTPLGWAAVELSHTHAVKERYEALLVSLLLIGGCILVNILIALRMSRTVTDPIYKLNQAVARLKEGRFDSRVQVDAGSELAQLESGLNEVAAALCKAQAEMQQNVDQATEDLRETLETIEIQNIELDLARKEALEASRIKSEFLANMSHEIRTPLNGIIGFTDILLKSPLSRQQLEHLTTIRKSSEILLTIINDILDFSKIEAGKLILDRIPYRLREIVEEVMVMLAPAAHAKDLDLVPLIYNDVPDDLVGDPMRIKQIITNLINNAIKFTPAGEVVLRAMLDDGEGQSLRIRLSVSDTGVGLSRAQQKALFHAFSQADASTARQYGGTGLGLVISRRLAEEMGGTIGLESELGKGSTFWFTLVSNAGAGIEPRPPREALAGERIIYLEQQETTGLATEHMLRDWGVRFDRVTTPREMAERVAAAQDAGEGYGAALLGLHRHLLNSLQYRGLIQQLELERDCRVLLLTPTLEESETAFAALASAHMVKPVCRSKLYDTLFRLIHGAPSDLPGHDHGVLFELESSPELENKAEPETPLVSQPRILAVDDNEANLKLVLTLLDGLDVTGIGAASGYEALGRLREQSFDLILMDVQMPGMDGIETTRRIRASEPSGQHLPIIALTAHALTDERTALLRSGFDAYVTKPIDSAQLAECITRHTGYRPQEQKAVQQPEPGNYSLRPSCRKAEARLVDIAAGVRLAADKPDLAEELFSMLMEHMIEDETDIRAHWRANDRAALLERVHKLHGATRYCGVPELRQCAHALETGLKTDDPAVPVQVEQLLSAIDRIQVWCERTDWQQLFRQSAETSVPESPVR